MKIVVEAYTTDGYPTKEEVLKLCKPGQGADTCIWLMAGPQGFECAYYHKHPTLIDRWKKGETVAKRDGCNEVKNMVIGHKRGVFERKLI